jgi:hypothetical protein
MLSSAPFTYTSAVPDWEIIATAGGDAAVSAARREYYAQFASRMKLRAAAVMALAALRADDEQVSAAVAGMTPHNDHHLRGKAT